MRAGSVSYVGCCAGRDADAAADASAGIRKPRYYFPMELIGGNVQAPLDFAIGSLAAWLLGCFVNGRVK
jgi:hypothetical protein